MSAGLRAARRKSESLQKIETADARRDIEHVAAFRNVQLVEEDVAARDAVQDAGRRIRAREAVLAGLQLFSRIDCPDHQELPGISDHASLRQLLRHGLGTGSLRKIDNYRIAKTLVSEVERQVRQAARQDRPE